MDHFRPLLSAPSPGPASGRLPAHGTPQRPGAGHDLSGRTSAGLQAPLPAPRRERTRPVRDARNLNDCSRKEPATPVHVPFLD